MEGTRKFTYKDIPYEVIDAGKIEEKNGKRRMVLMVEPVHKEALEKLGTAVLILNEDEELDDDILLHPFEEQPLAVIAFLLQYRKTAIEDHHRKQLLDIGDILGKLLKSGNAQELTLPELMEKISPKKEKKWELFHVKTGKETKLDDVLFDPSGSPYLLKEGGRPPKTINVTNSSGNVLDMAAGIFNLEWREVKA